jgi:hypothetical protein
LSQSRLCCSATALAVLADARDRCDKEDMHTDAVFAALDFLAA